MRAGRLDQRITVQKLGQTFDEFGQLQPGGYEDVLTCWAAVEPIGGREFVALLQAQSEISIRVRMRYAPGIDSTMRVRHGARHYGIASVINPRSADEELVLMCTSVA